MKNKNKQKLFTKILCGVMAGLLTLGLVSTALLILFNM